MITLGRITAIVAFMIALAFLGAVSVSAAETKTGDDLTVPRGEQIDGDLYVFGRTVLIAGIVNGDLIGSAERIEITGTVTGSVNVATGTLDITGRVDHAVRGTAGDVDVSGRVGGDIVIAAGELSIGASGSVGGDLLVGSGDVSIAGPVTGDVRGSADDVLIGAAVGGSVRLSVADLVVSENGTIAGDLRYSSNSAATIDDQAAIAGLTVRTSSLRSTGGPDLFSALTGQLARLLVGLVTGLVLVILLPKPVVGTADVIRTRFFGSAAAGIVGLVTWPIVAVLMAIIVVGIPIALIGTVLLLCIAYLSQVFVGLALGRVVLPRSWKSGTRGYNILAMAIGMIVLGALRSVPVPYVSAGIALFAAIVGVGGVLLALHSRTVTPGQPA